jgi:predicted GNAT family acetyltransferase
MQLKSFDNPTQYRNEVFEFLAADEAQYCLSLGLIDTMINNPETYPKAYLWAVYESDRVAGAAWMMPPHPIGLTVMPEDAVAALVHEASRIPDAPKSVLGPKQQSDSFKDRWTALHRLSVKSTMEQRIYKVTEVRQPFVVEGTMRPVMDQDFALLEDWNLRFSRDCGDVADPQHARESAVSGIANRSRYLWTVEGEAVSMAGASGLTPSGIRINWVYTPDRLRGRGFASALVATLSRKLLSEGRQYCFLYTDLANPTSNNIYQKIGYVAVCDSAHHTFQ